MSEFEENKDLVYKVLERKYGELNSYDRDDLIQEGNLALLHSISIYKEREHLRKYPFSSIAYTYISSRMDRWYHKNIESRGSRSDIESLDIEDSGVNVLDEVQGKLDVDATIKDIGKGVSSDNLELLIKNKVQGYTLVELAREGGVSVNATRNRVVGAIRKARLILG